LSTGTVVWNELNTRDQEAAKKFYGPLMGWEFETIPQGDSEYVMAKIGDAYVAGLFDLSTLPALDGVPDHWFTYFGVADIDASVAQVVATGGSVKRPVFEVMGGMRIAIVIDSNGAVLGLNQQPS
jgi:predicted enzyme related to lactoylglutathione lyase